MFEKETKEQGEEMINKGLVFGILDDQIVKTKDDITKVKTQRMKLRKFIQHSEKTELLLSKQSYKLSGKLEALEELVDKLNCFL